MADNKIETTQTETKQYIVVQIGSENTELIFVM